MKYFENVKTLDELKKQYRRLAMKYHPDMGGSTEAMQQINAEHDALFEMLGPDTFAKQQERGCIEVAPLAYMRGRTLDDSFIILDEAQNTTHEQMKMFLTRLGFNSKIVITGDITQIDLPDQRKSGLIQAMNVLKGIDDISINRFTDKDVVRHKLVQDIILAYEKYNKKGM